MNPKNEESKGVRSKSYHNFWYIYVPMQIGVIFFLIFSFFKLNQRKLWFKK